MPVGVEAHRDDLGVAGDRLVHRVVEHLGEEVMQRPLVGAADVHARPLADRLEAFEDLDVLCGVAARRALRLARGDRRVRARLMALGQRRGGRRVQRIVEERGLRLGGGLGGRRGHWTREDGRF
jgi:hypothetical protein